MLCFKYFININFEIIQTVQEIKTRNINFKWMTAFAFLTLEVMK